MHSNIRIPRRRMPARNHQGGFVTALILGAMALLAIIGAAYAYMSKGNSGNMDNEQARVQATLAVTTGNDLKAAIMRWQQDRNGLPLLTSAAGQLYDPALGLASARQLPGKAFASGTAADFALNTADINIGSDSNPDATLVLPGLTDQICRHINRAVLDMAIDAAIPTVANATGEGCSKLALGGGGAVNVYYKVVQVNL